MVALDQRPPIAQMLSAGLGVSPSQVGFDHMVAAKRLLVQALAREASAVLMDPNFALPAGLAWLPARTGLLATLEDHRFVETPGGRMSRSIANWSVEKIKRAGCDGVKVLVWYRPDAAAEVLAHQQAYVRQVGETCRLHDMTFVLELLDYPWHEGSTRSAVGDECEAVAQRVVDSLGEFAKPEYAVDLFKLQSPLPGSDLPEQDGSAEHRASQRWFDDMGAICHDAAVPWVMLSAGVQPDQFARVLRYACSAGANGFLAGRAIWAPALAHYPDLDACRESLHTHGLATLRSLTKLVHEVACPWTPDYTSLDSMRAEGDFCAACR